jgi:hypothetical protein
MSSCPAVDSAVGRVYLCKKAQWNVNLLLICGSHPLPGVALEASGPGRARIGTEAANRMVGGVVKVEQKPANQSPVGLVWLVRYFDWKVIEMARWMTRRIERSRARCQKTSTPKRSKSPEQEVGHSERKSNRTEGSTATVSNRS